MKINQLTRTKCHVSQDRFYLCIPTGSLVSANPVQPPHTHTSPQLPGRVLVLKDKFHQVSVKFVRNNTGTSFFLDRKDLEVRAVGEKTRKKTNNCEY